MNQFILPRPMTFKIPKPIFIFCLAAICMARCTAKKSDRMIMTVNGPVAAQDIGQTLTHEHILVDFSGADQVNTGSWDRFEVIQVVLPYLKDIKKLGCYTFFECTPSYLGRDPLLLKALSDSSGLNIITNTGYYGARNNKFLPAHAFTETADQLAVRWVEEWKLGINGTGIRPGFIKIGVDRGNLSEIHKKLVTAAARTHLKTGLTIASHTGPAVPAFEELKILKNEGVAPEAFIWVHAQAETDISNHIKAARDGVWISLDGLNDNNTEDYLKMLNNMRSNGLLDRALVSHDAGWYSPGEENGGKFRGYSALFSALIPLLKEAGFSDSQVDQLLVTNPQRAFAVNIRKIE